MSILNYLIPFAVGLGVLVAVHEYGHYWVARRCGVKVLRFSIGFGRPLVSWHAGRDRTEWAIGAFPLGGYVKMLDEREGEVAPAECHRAFNRQPVGKRMMVVAAGPLANLLLAVGLYWVVNLAGVEELKPRLALVEGVSAAATAGLAEGDLITAVDGEAIRSWQELRWALLKQALDGAEVHLDAQREDGTEKSVKLSLAGFDVQDGRNDLLAHLGIKPYRPPIAPVIGKLVDGGPAARSGMQVGDRVLAVNGEPIQSWSDLVAKVRASPGVPLRISFERGGKRAEAMATPDAESEHGEQIGRIGVAVADPDQGRDAMFVVVRYGPWVSLQKAVRQTWETSTVTLSLMGRMLTGEVSWRNLSGPVTIADYAGQSAQMGLDHYLKFLALISISLGVLNLLPVPVLDGGHLLYYTIELIKGGPIPERIMEIGQQIGLALLVMLMAFAFYNDINRLISG